MNTFANAGMIFLLALAGSGFGKDDVILGTTVHSLSANEELQLSQQALAGSASAAMKLSDKYLYERSSGNGEEMHKKALEWTVVAAENGSADAQFRAYELLSVSKNEGENVRALFRNPRGSENITV